jgi:hypothetical protein
MAAIRPINLEDLRTVFAEVLDKGHDCKQEGVIATLVEHPGRSNSGPQWNSYSTWLERNCRPEPA